MGRFIVQFILNAVAVWLTAQLIPGVTVSGAGGAVIAVVAIAVVNTLIRPIFSLLTLPLQFLTLGLFTLVLNGLMFWLASWIAGFLGGGFSVAGFLPAFIGAIVTSIISTVLSVLVPKDRD